MIAVLFFWIGCIEISISAAKQSLSLESSSMLSPNPSLFYEGSHTFTEWNLLAVGQSLHHPPVFGETLMAGRGATNYSYIYVPRGKNCFFMRDEMDAEMRFPFLHTQGGYIA